MNQDYRNRELIETTCVSLGSQLNLLSQAMILQEDLKDIERQMAENRRNVKGDQLYPGEVTTYNERFKHLQELHNRASLRKGWLDAQIVGPDQLLEMIDFIKKYAEIAIGDYHYIWGRGDQKKDA